MVVWECVHCVDIGTYVHVAWVGVSVFGCMCIGVDVHVYVLV